MVPIFLLFDIARFLMKARYYVLLLVLIFFRGIVIEERRCYQRSNTPMMDSKDKADKNAKAAAAILKATQLAADLKAKSNVEAQKAAAALSRNHWDMQHAEFINQITSEYHMPCYPGWTPPTGYAAEPSYTIPPRLIMTIRLTDYFVRVTDQGNIAELKEQWATFSHWLR